MKAARDVAPGSSWALTEHRTPRRWIASRITSPTTHSQASLRSSSLTGAGISTLGVDRLVRRAIGRALANDHVCGLLSFSQHCSPPLAIGDCAVTARRCAWAGRQSAGDCKFGHLAVTLGASGQGDSPTAGAHPTDRACALCDSTGAQRFDPILPTVGRTMAAISAGLEPEAE
jgi:hypothetical protein